MYQVKKNYEKEKKGELKVNKYYNKTQIRKSPYRCG